MTQEKAIKRLKLENALLYGLLALSLVYLVVVGENAVLDSRTLTQTAINVQKVFFLWQIYMIWRLVRNRRLLRESSSTGSQGRILPKCSTTSATIRCTPTGRK